MAQLVDNFENDLGEIVEVDCVDSSDPENIIYLVYVMPNGN
jgi:hypothetical protein